MPQEERVMAKKETEDQLVKRWERSRLTVAQADAKKKGLGQISADIRLEWIKKHPWYKDDPFDPDQLGQAVRYHEGDHWTDTLGNALYVINALDNQGLVWVMRVLALAHERGVHDRKEEGWPELHFILREFIQRLEALPEDLFEI
jgi:hypothetical protein